MIVSPDYQWLYISTMKAATNTCYKALQDIGGNKLGHGKHPYPNCRFANIHFSTIRNPYSRAVSIWAFNRKELSFDDFCKKCLGNRDIHNSTLYDTQSNWYKRFIVDKLIHIENLKEEIEEIVGKLPELPILNKSEHNSWEEYMTPESINRINEWAEEDFDLGGYKKL